MSNKTKKRARRAVKRTAKVVKKFSASVGPVLAGVAAGLAARDVAGSSSSYLEDVGRDIARLVRTIGSRAAAVVHTQPEHTARDESSAAREHAA